MELIEERRKTSELLLDVMKSFSSELSIDALLRKIMERTSRVLQADRSTLFLVDSKTREIWSKVAQGRDMVEIRVPIGRGIAGTVAATGETINIPDAYADPRFNQDVDRRTGYRTRTILCAPGPARSSASRRCSTRPAGHSPATTSGCWTRSPPRPSSRSTTRACSSRS